MKKLALLGGGRVARAFAARLAPEAEARGLELALLVRSREARVGRLDLRAFAAGEDPGGETVPAADPRIAEALAAAGAMVEALPSTPAAADPFLEPVLAALARGADLVAAGKHLLAVHGERVLAAARAGGARVGISAAVGVGLPLAAVLRERLRADDLVSVEALLNGTTNAVLALRERGLSHDEAVREARDKGLAEPDPTDDLDGGDAVRKAAILARFVLGAPVPLESVARRPLAHDLASLGDGRGRVKQRALLRREGERLVVDVGLARYESPHPFAALEGGAKGARVETARGGVVTILGGAGGLAATADALLADLASP